MPDGATLPVLDHELADDELQWMKSVYAKFSKARATAGPEFNPKEALRAILAHPEYRLSAAPDLTGLGPWRLGQNRHGRGVAAVFLPKVELHTHIASRTDQFPMYVMGDAEGFSIDENGKPVWRRWLAAAISITRPVRRMPSCRRSAFPNRTTGKSPS